ncbi:CBS domain-containing protein [Chroococcidiopsis sp.]|uniref:CBS domain-containing protein n=1 Tax=Chroococcidiopsis sp. TaxID=3088168 RepID=UPI003F2C6463
MDLILCHTTADFDALGAAVGLSRLWAGAKIVLTGGSHPAVKDFLALHRDEYALIERRSVNPKQIRSLIVVDTQHRDRLGAAAEWLDLPQIEQIVVYDHHLEIDSDISTTATHIADVGATTTLIVEELQAQQVEITPFEATVMALGIHVDTGSLSFDQANHRDALALAWLMQQGASLHVVRDYIDPGFSPQLQALLTEALDNFHCERLRGYTVTWVLLKTPGYVSGLSSLAARLMELTESDAVLLGARYALGDSGEQRLTVIGRSQIPGTNLNELFQPLGGGGHSQAASLSLRGVDGQATLQHLVDRLKATIPHPPTARELMSSPVRTIRPDTTIAEAQRILLRYGHSGLSVVDPTGKLVGIISRRDIDIALHHGFSHAPAKGYMTTNIKTITPETTLPEIQALMVTYDIGRLPVLQDGELRGIVTRTDVLRELHQEGARSEERGVRGNAVGIIPPAAFLRLLSDRLAAPFWELLTQASAQAEQRGWHLYLVGGGVRDLLLAKQNGAAPLYLQDIDLVVDGFHRAADVGAGVELARALQQLYPAARLEIHGVFQTAALLWHKDPIFGSLWIDIATARTEFYPYPAANPEVEASSIRQDLYRRDFTINSLAVRLTPPRAGEMLDFFGGLLDLQAKQIRVLHPNSFIEDPTRIYRAVRFAVRLEFAIEPQTENYIRYAINSGIYKRTQGNNSRAPALQTRLKNELKYILQAPYWQAALSLLGDLDALQCLHETLKLDKTLWQQLRFLERCLRRFHRESGVGSRESGKGAERQRGRGAEGQRGRGEILPLTPHSSLLTPPWLLRLEVLIAYLAPEYRDRVAQNLQLPDDSINRLRRLQQAQERVLTVLPSCLLPSQVFDLLRQYDLPMLILIALRSPRPVRALVWQYVTYWANVQPLLNGHDLKQLGYKPGPQYRQILDDLLAATLDGIIRDRTEAESYLFEHYPR